MIEKVSHIYRQYPQGIHSRPSSSPVKVPLFVKDKLEFSTSKQKKKKALCVDKAIICMQKRSNNCEMNSSKNNQIG